MITDARRLLNAKYCDRCNRELTTRTMSIMNTDIICMDCAEEEKQHPDFIKAFKAEREAIKKGITNYAGLFAGQKYPFGRCNFGNNRKTRNF